MAETNSDILTFRPIWSFEWEKTLGANYGQRVAYSTLWSYANRDLVSWPGMEAMCERSGFERTGLSKAIKQLNEKGLIRVHRYTHGKTKQNNSYDLSPNLNRTEEEIKLIIDHGRNNKGKSQSKRVHPGPHSNGSKGALRFGKRALR